MLSLTPDKCKTNIDFISVTRRVSSRIRIVQVKNPEMAYQIKLGFILFRFTEIRLEVRMADHDFLSILPFLVKPLLETFEITSHDRLHIHEILEEFYW